MFKDVLISTETIGTIREVTLEFHPNLIGRLVGRGSGTMAFRSSGETWFTYPAGERVDPQMVTFLENAWSRVSKGRD